jgi:hypothetical protein
MPSAMPAESPTGDRWSNRFAVFANKKKKKDCEGWLLAVSLGHE